MTVWPELHDKQAFYRLRHWLRDGGLSFMFDTLFWSIALVLMSALLAAYLITQLIRIPDKVPVPTVIDHHKEIFSHKE